MSRSGAGAWRARSTGRAGCCWARWWWARAPARPAAPRARPAPWRPTWRLWPCRLASRARAGARCWRGWWWRWSRGPWWARTWRWRWCPGRLCCRAWWPPRAWWWLRLWRCCPRAQRTAPGCCPRWRCCGSCCLGSPCCCRRSSRCPSRPRRSRASSLTPSSRWSSCSSWRRAPRCWRCMRRTRCCWALRSSCACRPRCAGRTRASQVARVMMAWTVRASCATRRAGGCAARTCFAAWCPRPCSSALAACCASTRPATPAACCWRGCSLRVWDGRPRCATSLSSVRCCWGWC
mmetsp:Transcript_29043/g.74106  ORF Transcript_29043/g.74106 Transcript_29043/m.74106 type:complete len:292 (-) Transcript_29043:833-1708(-)